VQTQVDASASCSAEQKATPDLVPIAAHGLQVRCLVPTSSSGRQVIDGRPDPFRCLLRILKRPHLDRRSTSQRSFAGPRKCFIQIGGFQYPKTHDVFLALGVRAVGDEYLAIALGPEGPGIAGRGKTAYEN